MLIFILNMMNKFIFFLLCGYYGSSMQTASDSLQAINKRVQDLENRIEVCEKEAQSIRKRAVGTNVAFSTLLSHNQQHIGIGLTIKFDQVLLNDGSGYSVHSGTFAVPVSGVYLFAFYFAHTYSIGQVWLELMRNGNKINAGVTDAFHLYQDLQGGNIAIIRAQSGDAIWVEAYHQNDAELHGHERFTSFSGALLY